MYTFIKRTCKLCAGCGLSNSFNQPLHELVDNFPIDAPFKVICGDIYKAGDIKAYQGESALFIIMDKMTCFAIIEELVDLNAVEFIKAAMKVSLQNGLCHTSVVD